MNAEQTCRFCHRQMTWSVTYIPTRISTGPHKDYQVEQFHCNRCSSNQEFRTDTGQSLDYTFDIGAYRLCFYPHNQTFKIKYFPQGKLQDYTVVLEMNYLPHNLTPSTMTVDRIKTLITFS